MDDLLDWTVYIFLFIGSGLIDALTIHQHAQEDDGGLLKLLRIKKKLYLGLQEKEVLWNPHKS